MDKAGLVKNDYGADLARVVYGGHHFDHEHKQF